MSTTPQFVSDLLAVLTALALPAALCSMVLAGVALRQEGGFSFEMGGRFQRWVLWSVIFLTVPQILSWFAGQGIVVPISSSNASPWLNNISVIFKNFAQDVVLARLVPILAAFFVLKAPLDVVNGHSPLASVISAIFLLSVSSSVQLMQTWNSGGQFAVTDMLSSIWTYIAYTILPEAAGLAVVGAIVSFIRHRPVAPLIAAALAFLSVPALWKLVQAMVGA